MNIASRMESNSEEGKINISENTFNLVKDQFCCSYRGEIEAKNKGKLKMYYVNAIKSKDEVENRKESLMRPIHMDGYSMKA